MTVIGLEIIFMLLVVVVGIAARDLWGYLFTSDPEVRLLQWRKGGRLIHAKQQLPVIVLMMQCPAAQCMSLAPCQPPVWPRYFSAVGAGVPKLDYSMGSCCRSLMP